MNDIIEKARDAVAEALAFRFPQYPVRFEQVGDETNMLGVGVFAVPPADFAEVQDYIFDLEAAGVLPDGWELLPLVRDPATTLKHYPEILDNWSAPVRHDIVPQDTPVLVADSQKRQAEKVAEAELIAP
ncbi:MAG TPA: hypothetical protein PK251_15230 [Candidatus Latescibacteria bacterium]|jgi:hypothetical protein|nr:hypothetical protein [Candidatus Latescibacterota bacterium]HOS66092.1 hypothetical protein [Candidatus Latescibacterota bacterium]